MYEDQWLEDAIFPWMANDDMADGRDEFLGDFDEAFAETLGDLGDQAS